MEVSPEMPGAGGGGALNGLFVERNCGPSLRINLSSNSKHTKQNPVFTHLPTSSDPTGEGILPPTPHPD